MASDAGHSAPKISWANMDGSTPNVSASGPVPRAHKFSRARISCWPLHRRLLDMTLVTSVHWHGKARHSTLCENVNALLLCCTRLEM